MQEKEANFEELFTKTIPEHRELSKEFYEETLDKTLEIYKDTRMPPPTSVEELIIDAIKLGVDKLKKIIKKIFINEVKAMENNRPFIPEISETQNFRDQIYKK